MTTPVDHHRAAQRIVLRSGDMSLSCTVQDARDLHAQLGELLRAADTPTLTETEDRPGRLGLRCPHCGYLHIDGQGPIEVDIAYRWNHSITDPDSPRTVCYSYDGHGDYATDHHLCYHCHHPVTLPTGWSTEGT